MISRNLSALIIGVVLCIASGAALADGGLDPAEVQHLLNKDVKHPVVVKPLKNDDAIRLTTNRDKIIRLNQDAASVVVNNPAHAEVLLDSPRLLIVMPRAPGATSFTVLNATGDIIFRRDIIVTNVQQKYVRIRRMCSGNDASCLPSAYYYCPDGCYEVTPVGEPTGSGGIPAPAGNATGTDNSAAILAAQPQGANGAAGGGPVITGPGAPMPQQSAAPDNHPVGPDNEPLTVPGQKP